MREGREREGERGEREREREGEREREREREREKKREGRERGVGLRNIFGREKIATSLLSIFPLEQTAAKILH